MRRTDSHNPTTTVLPGTFDIIPPPRSTPAGAAVSCAMVILMSAVVMAPHGSSPWATATGALLAAAAFATRAMPAFHLSLFGFFWLVLPLLHPIFRAWPVNLAAPLAAYGLLVAALPSLRRTFGWLRRGRLGPDILTAVAVIAVISGAALVCWYLAVRPEPGQVLRNMPLMPVWLYPFAGIAFALGNAALEESVFRGIVMDALDSAFGPGRTSIALQAAPFALFHFHGGFPSGYWGVALAFIYGLMLGAVRRRAKGMLAPWLAHVGADSVIFIILAWVSLR